MTGGKPGERSAPDAIFAYFFRVEVLGGLVLLACTLIALALANSAWAPLHERVSDTKLGALSLRHWINDLLMAVFFLVVGLEIKREVMGGELSSRERAALPVAAAVGGMAVPAAAYAWLNAGGDSLRGWGIPMATDIAFALGILALFGRRVPPGLRVLLAALAIVDDIGAVLVIALVYSERIAGPALAAAVVLLLAMRGAFGLGVRRVWLHAVLGLGVWLAVFLSGVHATIAGILVAMVIPPRPALRLEHVLHPVQAFAILPLFGLFNAGVALGGTRAGDGADPVLWGVVLGLVAGKPVGITLASWLAVRAGIGRLPAGVTWAQVVAVGCLAGVGFTMALFISDLAFADAPRLGAARTGILTASALAALLGAGVLAVVLPRRAAA